MEQTSYALYTESDRSDVRERLARQARPTSLVLPAEIASLGQSGPTTAQVPTRREGIVFRLPRVGRTPAFRSEQQWRGVVTRVSGQSFWARLTALSEQAPDEEAEFELDVVDDEDQLLVEAGAIFYWSIGNLDLPSGRVRASIVRFARLSAWTAEEISSARESAAERLKRFDARTDSAGGG